MINRRESIVSAASLAALAVIPTGLYASDLSDSSLLEELRLSVSRLSRSLQPDQFEENLHSVLRVGLALTRRSIRKMPSNTTDIDCSCNHWLSAVRTRITSA